MSRSRNHPKYGDTPQGKGYKQRALGYDFWTERPGNRYSPGYGTLVKKHTHRLERLVDKTLEKDPENDQ